MAGPSRTCCVSEYCTGVPHNEHPQAPPFPAANFNALHQKCGRARYLDSIRAELIGILSLAF